MSDPRFTYPGSMSPAALERLRRQAEAVASRSISPELMERLNRQAEMVSKSISPELMERLNRQAEVVSKSISPELMERLNRQAEMVSKSISPELMERLNRQAEMVSKSISPELMERLNGQVETIGRTISPAVLASLDQQVDGIGRMMAPSIIASVERRLLESDPAQVLADLDAIADQAAQVDGLDAGAVDLDGPLPVDAVVNFIAFAITLWLLGMYLSEMSRTGDSVAEMNRLDLVQTIGWCLGAGLGSRALLMKLGTWLSLPSSPPDDGPSQPT